jgi:hypothetical protein
MCAWNKSFQFGDEEKLIRKRKVNKTEAGETWERGHKQMGRELGQKGIK